MSAGARHLRGRNSEAYRAAAPPERRTTLPHSALRATRLPQLRIARKSAAISRESAAASRSHLHIAAPLRATCARLIARCRTAKVAIKLFFDANRLIARKWTAPAPAGRHRFPQAISVEQIVLALCDNSDPVILPEFVLNGVGAMILKSANSLA